MVLGLQRGLLRCRFGLRDRRRGFWRTAVKIGDRGFGLRRLPRHQLVTDRPRKSVVAIATATTSATATAASAAAGTPLAIALIVVAGEAWLLLGIIVLGIAFLGHRFTGCFGRTGFGVVARLARLAFATTASAPPPAASCAALAAAFLLGFAVGGLAGFLGQA